MKSVFRRTAILAAIVTLVALLPVGASAQPFSAPQFVLKFGGAPDGSASGDPGRFSSIGLGGIATSPDGVFVYVVDGGDVAVNRVQKFDSVGNFIMQWGSTGSGDGQFSSPLGLTVDMAGNVYVCDFGGGGRIQKFDSNGNFLLKWYDPQGAFVIAGSDGFIYTDRGNPTVGKWDTNGVLQMSIGSGIITSARGLAMDSSGNLYVREGSNNNVHKFNSVTGAYLGTIITGVTGIYSLGIDSQNRLHLPAASGAGSAFVKVFDTAGTLLGQYGSYCDLSTGTGCVDPDGAGPFQLGDGQFKFGPKAIFSDVSGSLYIGDYNNRVQKFAQVLATPTPTSTPVPTATSTPVPTFTSTPVPTATSTPVPTVSACVQNAAAVMCRSVSSLSSSMLSTLDSACTSGNLRLIASGTTNNGNIKVYAGQVLVVGCNATLNGGAQENDAVDGQGSGVIFLGSGVQVNGKIKGVGTVYRGSNVTVTGGISGGTVINF